MTQLFAVIGFMLVAILIFGGGLYFAQYKKKANAGCCGGGNCSADGTSGSCYSSKTDFVDNFDKIKADRLEGRK